MTADVLDRPDLAADEERMFVTLTVADQLCGVPVLSVRDILGEQAITRIPLAPPEIAGSLNLRGRIVTAIDLRERLHLPVRRACPSSPIRVASFMRCWLIRLPR
jgi:purine-binding chemotaxis protein CheW